MMLFKLSLQNIKKSFKDYAIYFFTLILGVAIFYIFNAIDSQTVMLNISSSTREIIELMISMLSGVSVFVSFILGFLIIYASRFLMKRRNKEFGIYLTLGMSKGKISKILLIETILIGLLSLFVGLGLGVFLSQFMSIFVANMFNANLTQFTFTFSMPALIKTIGYFGVMYIIVMIFNTISVSKCKLIDLLYAHKKAEKVKMKNPILCVMIFIISAIVLGYAYYLVTANIQSLQDAKSILIPIAMGCISTFFLFWSLSGLLLRIVKSIKGFYYQSLHSFTFRQISSKINTTVMSMSIICIMLFLTICILSSAISLKDSMNKNIEELAPVDIQLSTIINMDESDKKMGYNELQIKNSKQNVMETLDYIDFDYQKYFKEFVEISIYKNNLTLVDTLGTALEEVKKEYSFLNFNTNETFIKISDYNKLAKILGLKEQTLKKNEYILVADYDSFIKIREAGLKANTPITLSGLTLYPQSNKCEEGYLEISSTHINTGIFIVPDEAITELEKKQSILTANYNGNTEEEKRVIEELLVSRRKNKINEITLSANTKIMILEASIGLGAMVTFIGIYLGIIFLLSSAAILALKELSESADNKDRYQILRKIGVDEKQINQSLFSQMAIFFLAPLLLALIHSIFGIKFSNLILETFGTSGLLPSILVTASVILIIYGGYFLITYYTSKNIIKN